MGLGVPDEIRVQDVSEVIPGRILGAPLVDAQAVECPEDRTFTTLLAFVAAHQISRALGNFEAHLHAHRAFG
jgi:hypothetical protein